ncbi:MAG: hypothetical protein Ct9H90mP2_05300 [Dehalococcoidia bacterium]|nr:MAG: hypothetical protein Ct9H90mP2_05300 [Dehalococcoidia bacterium]
MEVHLFMMFWGNKILALPSFIETSEELTIDLKTKDLEQVKSSKKFEITNKKINIKSHIKEKKRKNFLLHPE